jgi:hypothetical protein
MMHVESEIADKGYTVGITQLCRWFGISRGTFYYHPKTREKYLTLFR